MEPGVVIGSYVIEELLGQGTEGSVYVARDSLLGRQVALKTLRVAEVGETRGVEEARLLSTLEHQHIVRVYHARRHQGVWYVVYEYLAGGSLQALIERQGRLSPEEALGLMSQAASGLAFVHAQGILHRDIKPQNLLLSRRGELKLGDFGLAFDGRSGRRAPAALVGTAAFIAPELWRGEPASSASDVFSLGACLFLLLCGRLPFVGTTREQIKQAHAELLPKLPTSLPGPVAELLTAMLAKEPAARPSSDQLPRLLSALAESPYRSLAALRGENQASQPSSPFSDGGPLRAVREVLRSARDVTHVSELVQALSRTSRGVELCSQNPIDGLLLLDAAREVGAETRPVCGRLNLTKASASICEVIERQLGLPPSGDLAAACRSLLEPVRRSQTPSILVLHCPRGLSAEQSAELQSLCERATALGVTSLLLAPLPRAHDAEPSVPSGFERVIAFRALEDARELEERMRLWLRFATADRYHFSTDGLRLAAHYCRSEQRFWATLALQSLLIACAAELRVITSWAIEGARAQLTLWYDPSEVPAVWRKRPLAWPTPELLVLFEQLRADSASRYSGGGQSAPPLARLTFETLAV
jgi:serine/threonine protein kinase